MNKHSGTQKKHSYRPSLFFFVSLFLGLIALLFHVLSAKNVLFADTLNTLGAFVRKALGYLSALAPFSIAEALLLLLPLWLVLLILLAKRAARDKARFVRMLSTLLAVPLLFYSLFVFSYASGYYVQGLDQKMSLPEREVDGDTLYLLSLSLSEKAEEAAKEAGVAVGDGGSQMPMSYAQMNQSLIRAYDTLVASYPFLSNFAVGTKPVMLSRPMAYTHITGVYSFFTGEMNVCTAWPDFSTVFTAAHEMAHARGIAREDEANFVAFLACQASDNPYIRYAGYMNLLQYVSNALYETDRDKFAEAWEEYSDILYREFSAYNEAYRRYSGSIASDVAGSVNNAYLESMGTGGSVSYRLVVRLAVRYFS